MTCPKCGTLKSIPLGSVGADRATVWKCSLCNTVWSPERTARVASYYSLQPEPLEPRSVVARLRDAAAGALAGWRGTLP